MEVGSEDSVERFGVESHSDRHGVYKHVIGRLLVSRIQIEMKGRTNDIRELFGDFVDHFVPEDHTVSHSVRLCDIGQELSRSGLCDLVGVSSDSLDTDSREDCHL